MPMHPEQLMERKKRFFVEMTEDDSLLMTATGGNWFSSAEIKPSEATGEILDDFVSIRAFWDTYGMLLNK